MNEEADARHDEQHQRREMIGAEIDRHLELLRVEGVNAGVHPGEEVIVQRLPGTKTEHLKKGQQRAD